MSGIDDIICYLDFSNAGVWVPASIEIQFVNGDSKEYGATNQEGIEIHIPEDDVIFCQDPETEEDFLKVSAEYDQAIKEIIKYQAHWNNLPHHVTYKQY